MSNIVVVKSITKEKVILQSKVVLGGGGGGSVSSVNGQVGTVVLNADAISDTGTTNKYATQGQLDKIDGVESGATADQSDAEIKTAYENNANTNAFTDAEQSKLSGVATGATANASDADLRDRSTHTGTQAASTISDFNASADARIAAADLGDLNNVSPTAPTTGQVLKFDGAEWAPGTDSGGSGGAVDSVNTQTGDVVLDADDISDASTTNKFATQGQLDKIDGVEAGADVTDTANVTAAGALMDSELTDLAGVKALDTSTLQEKPIEGAFVDGDKTKLDNIEEGANDYSHPNHTGDVTSVGDGTTTIANDAVTNAKMANMATNRIKGRNSSGVGDPEDLTIPTVRSMLNVEDGADVTDTANVTAAGALMDSELTDLAGIKALDTSTIQSKPSEGAFVDGDKTKLDGIETSATANPDAVDSDPTGVTGADAITNMMSLTQAEYNAIGTPDAATFYLITDAT